MSTRIRRISELQQLIAIAFPTAGTTPDNVNDALVDSVTATAAWHATDNRGEATEHMAEIRELSEYIVVECTA